MLVLSRRTGESICIDSNIRVSVLRIKGGQVRLGLSAPPEISVHRGEIQQRINAALAERCAEDSPADAAVV